MRRLFYLMNLLFALMLPVQVLAATVDDYKAAVNDTTFYDPVSDGLCNIAASGGGSLSGKDSEEKIWNWLTAKGLSDVQAAGVMGNMAVESAGSWSPTIQQIGSPWPLDGYGLAQWTYGRRDTLVSALQKQPNLYKYYDPKYDGQTSAATGYVPAGIPVADNDALILFELNFLYQESNVRAVTATGFGSGPNEWSVLKKQTTIDNATVFWHNNFEVSTQSPFEVLRDRGGAAHGVYNTYHTGGATTGGAATPDTSCASSNPVSGKLSTVILAYAWPTYHAPEFTAMTPDYAKAVAATQAAGGYVGSPPGIDCGGFVTIVMHDSGFEPNYNALKGNTIAQRAWAQANWQDLGPATSIDTSKLHLGDVAISDEHTYMWVGTIPGFGAKIASASTGAGYYRSGMADTQQNPAEAGFEWFRKK